MTSEFISLVDNKELWARICRQRPTTYNLARMRQAVRDASNLMKSLKKAYIQDAILECNRDYTKLWKVIKRFWLNKAKNVEISKMLDVTNNQEIAEVINQHFCNIGHKLASCFTDVISDELLDRMRNDSDTSFSFEPVTLKEVAELMRGLSPSKACGANGLTARLLKAYGDTIHPVLIHIFNQSFTRNEFPAVWKVAKVTPLYKEGSCSDPGNYHPISVLPILSKELERVAHNRLYDFISRNNLLTASQSGFRKGHSTGTCLMDFLQNIYDGVESGCATGELFLDLKKVFDTVNHRILVSTLSKMGLSSDSLDWVDSYLYGRVQHTFVNGYKSLDGQVECGVPQGSILGPLFFILYINNLPTVLTKFSVYLYADDTAIAVRGNNTACIIETLNEELAHASSWFTKHQLSLNMKKTCVMFFV